MGAIAVLNQEGASMQVALADTAISVNGTTKLGASSTVGPEQAEGLGPLCLVLVESLD